MYLKVKIQNEKNLKLDGCDFKSELLITPWEAVLGLKTSIEILDDNLTIYIPKGIQSGETVVISNKGYKSEKNGKRGNLIIKVKIVVPREITNEEELIYKKLGKMSKFNPRNNK